MRPSETNPAIVSSQLTPRTSAACLISFIKETLVAKKQLPMYFINCAVVTSVLIIFICGNLTLNNSSVLSRYSFLPPKIIRGALIKSNLALLSVKNSGLCMIFKFGYFSINFSIVPGVTVDLTIKILSSRLFISLMLSKTSYIILGSIAPPSAPRMGVGTDTKTKSDEFTVSSSE